MGELGPIDPAVTNWFNPIDPDDPDKLRRVPVSVENASAYLSLAKDLAGIDPEHMSSAFDALSRELHPLALGNVHRQYLLIRTMAKRLLQLHMTDDARIEKVLDLLTEKLYSHDYCLSRVEAREYAELPIVDADPPLETAMWALLSAYNGEYGC
jgi:hypothetical protein